MFWLKSLRESSAIQRTGHAQIAVVLTVVGCLLVLDAIVSGPFEAARTWVFDTYHVWWPPDRPVSRTVVVEIDDESIRRFGQWPWPRDQLAALLNGLRGASAVGVDVLMPEPDRLSPDDLIWRRHIEAPALRDALLALPRPDEALAVALRAQPTVLAMTVGDRVSTGASTPAIVSPVREPRDFVRTALLHASGASWPLPMLAEAARGVGTVSAGLGIFGEIGKLPGVVDVRGTLLPGFATELIRVASKAGAIVLKAPFGILSAISIDGLTFHVDPSGEVRPRFVGPTRLTTIKAHLVLDRAAEQPELAGKIVVIGVTASGVGETFQTPLGVPESSPEVWAEMIESILAGDTLWRPYWAAPAEGGAAFVLGLAGGLLLGRIRYSAYLAASASILLLLVTGSVWAFRRHGILLDWVFPSCCLGVSAMTASAAQTGAEVAARKRHEAALAIERVRRAALEREVELADEAETLRQRLGFAVDAARLGVWDADLRSGIWYHSPRHDAILGLATAPQRWSPDILLNRVVPEDRAAVQHSLTEGQVTGALQMECGISRPDGSLAYIHILGRFWRDFKGVPSRVAGVVVDITRQRELELRLRQGERLQAVGLLAGGVAHNFNNLLAVVLGNLELASAKVDPSSRVGTLLSNAIDAAHKGAGVARQLLAFARLQPLNPKPVDAAELLKAIVLLLRNALPASVQISLEMASHLGTLRIDPANFELALLNLAMNARDAMAAGGHLVLHAFNQEICDERLGLDGNFLVLEVKDDGEGMSPETVSKVFEPFFTTKPVGKGTGLGLSQVHGFAHQSGGAVDIISERGRGTRVSLYLPLTVPQPHPAESRQEKASR